MYVEMVQESNSSRRQKPLRITWKMNNGNLLKKNHFRRSILRRSLHQTSTLIEDLFSTTELMTVLNTLKRNKAPGPDLVTAEMVTELDATNRAELLVLINESWAKNEWPNVLDEANNVSIFKKEI